MSNTPCEYTVGDTVYSRVFHMEGNVVVIDDDGWCGVRFEGWEDGHNLDGALPPGSGEGYWVRPSDLELCGINVPSVEVFDELF